MVVHVYFKDNSKSDFFTNHVTVFTPGSEPGWLAHSLTPCLVIGTRPDFHVIRWELISWYWIEEN